jgi:hypothetical protein
MGGDNTTGGGGSVLWYVDANKVNKNQTKDTHSGSQTKGRHEQSGRDQHDTDGSFTIDIKVPANEPDRTAFLNNFTLPPNAQDRISFTLPIEPEMPNTGQPNQIHIQWGGGGSVDALGSARKAGAALMKVAAAAVSTTKKGGGSTKTKTVKKKGRKKK